MPDVVSGPSLTSARTGPGTLAGPVGNATEPDAAGRRLRGPSSLRPPPCGEGRSCWDDSLASETSSSLQRACGPQDVSGSWPGSGLGDGRTGLPRYPPCPCQDSAGQGVAARHLCARHSPQVSSGGNHSGRLRHIRSPLAGETPAPSFRMDRRAPRPGCVLTDLNLHRRSLRCSRSPRRPVVTARNQPCVFPHAGALRPCRASSCSVCFATSPVRMVEHPTGPFASGFQRPSLRGVVRAQARTEARAWRVTRRRLETRRAMPCRARCRTWRPTLGEAPSQRPRGRRSRSFTPFQRRLPPNGPTQPGCPGR